MAYLKPIKKEFYDEYLGAAMRYYGEKQFKTYVLFWPDKENKLPWEDGYKSELQLEALKIVSRRRTRMHDSGDLLYCVCLKVCKSSLMLLDVFHGVHR